MRKWALGALVFLLPACGEEFATALADVVFSDDEEEELPPPPLPDLERLDAEAACVDYYAARFPRLAAELWRGDGTILLDWPGGFVVELTIEWTSEVEVAFSNDEARDGFRFRGWATARADRDEFVDGFVEFRGMGPCDLAFGAWRIEPGLPLRGRFTVNPDAERATKGTVYFAGDGSAIYSGSFREPGTLSVPVQFTIPLD